MSQCNFCGYTEPHPADLQIGSTPRPVVPCEHCQSQLCSACKPNHEVICRGNAKKKSLGIGPTVSAITYEHRAGHMTPETTPAPRPRDTRFRDRPALPGEVAIPVRIEHEDPFDVIASLSGKGMEANEGPWVDHDTIAKDLNLVSEAPQNANVQSNSEPVLQSEQNPEAQTGDEGSSGRGSSPEVDPSVGAGHVGDASRDSDNGASAPEPEVSGD